MHIIFFPSNCDETPILTEFVRLQSTNLNVFHAQLCITTTVHNLYWVLIGSVFSLPSEIAYAHLLVIQFCSWLINIHIFNYPDSWLSRPFSPVPTSPDNNEIWLYYLVSFQQGLMLLGLMVSSSVVWYRQRQLDNIFYQKLQKQVESDTV